MHTNVRKYINLCRVKRNNMTEPEERREKHGRENDR